MIFFKTIIICIIFTFSSNVFSNENSLNSGWTKELQKASVDSCIASAVNNNMEHIIDKDNIQKDSDEYIKILKEVKKYQTAVCKCTQDKIMKNYKFSEIGKIMDDKNFIIDAAKNCNQKILAKNKN